MTMVSKHSLLFYCIAALSASAVSSFHVPGSLLLTSRSNGNQPYTSNTRLYSDSTKGKNDKTNFGPKGKDGKTKFGPKGKNGKTKFGQKTDEEVSRFLTEFRTADGNVVDPYKMLRVSRSATKMEIKQSYRRLSRKLHPDMVAQSEILPGRCANLEEVRDEWERVKFSYEILSDPKTRKSYDRNSSVAEVLEDPAAAMGRAVVGGAMSGVGMVLGGAWKLGEMAVKTATKK